MSKFALSLTVAAAAISLACAAHAASPQTPTTAWGKPDLSGTWTNQSLTPLTRAKPGGPLEVDEATAKKMADSMAIAGIDDPSFKNATYSDPNAPAPPKGDKDFGTKGYDSGWVTPGTMLGKVHGKYRTSDIVEPASGELPYRDLAAAAKRAQARGIAYVTGNSPYENPEDTAISERCLIGFGGTGGPGMLSVLYNNNYQFVLTKDHLAIDVEMAHDVRIIPIFDSAAKARASHKPAVIKPWLGDSVAWWEGPTLVVETTDVRPLQGENGPFYLTPNGKVTERLTRTSDKEIFYQFTVDDPATYTQPWKAELTFYPSPGIYEYACHEGNYGLEGILAGARAKEKEAAAAAKKQAAR
jgi:hypothetical protein